jgi:transposase
MPRVADVVDAVVGGDTHADIHVLEMTSPAGGMIATTRVSNDAAGFAAALGFITEYAPGPRVFVGLEATRSYGIGLARALAAAGLVVVEVEHPARRTRRGKGKSDPIDAHHAALAVLAMDLDRLPTPRADGDREALRILLAGRQEMTDTRTRQANQLRALLRTGDDTDRAHASGAWTKGKLLAVSRRRARTADTREQAVRGAEARRLATAILALDAQLAENTASLTEIVTGIAPRLLERCGIGPVSAAQAIVSFSHPGRCRSEAAFAALAGAAPLPASSGKTIRHRLNRGGDRALNRALHSIALVRMINDPGTRAYVARRTADGRTSREIRRCLKRYIARELYRHLTVAMRQPA